MVSTYVWHPNSSPICPEGPVALSIKFNPIHTYILPTVVSISHLTRSQIVLVDSHLTRSLITLVLASTYGWHPKPSPKCPEGYVSSFNKSDPIQTYILPTVVCCSHLTWSLITLLVVHLTRSLIKLVLKLAYMWHPNPSQICPESYVLSLKKCNQIQSIHLFFQLLSVVHI